MNQQLTYIDPTTSARIAVTPQDPTVILDVYGKRDFPDLAELSLKMTQSIGGVSRIQQLNAFGLYGDLLYGGFKLYPWAYQDKCARITADLTNIATAMTIDRSTTDFNGTSTNIFAANQLCMLMNRLPNPGETPDTTAVNAEIIKIDSGYSSGTSVTIARSTGGTARKKGAIVAPLFAPHLPHHPNGFDFGILYELERPTAVTSLTATDGGSQEIDIVWPHVAQGREASHTNGNYAGPGVVSHYWVYVVKLADTYAPYNTLLSLPDNAEPSLVIEINSSSLTVSSSAVSAANPVVAGTNITYAGLTQYWASADNSLNSIIAGTYFVAIMAANGATVTRDLRVSRPTISAAVTVA